MAYIVLCNLGRVTRFGPHTLVTLRTCLSSLYRSYSSRFVRLKDNIGPLRINLRYPAINSSIMSYLSYHICSVSNLTLLFKTVGRKSQFEVITCILVIYLVSWGPQNLGILIFLQLSLSTTINLYLQLCHYNLIITNLSLLFLCFP